MPIDDPNRLYDGFSSLQGGMDGGRRPKLIDPTQCAESDNVIFRGGVPSTRPSFLDVTLSFDNPNLTYDSYGRRFVDLPNNGLYNFYHGLFQGADYFRLSDDKQYFMVTIGGRLYRITPGVGQTADIFEVGMDFRNSSIIAKNYMVQADVYHITQDGESLPIIFDGAAARRAESDEIFTGRAMGCGMGRIVLISNSGDIYFGDIFDGTGHGAADMLKFTETKFLNEGFPSRVPSFMGDPVAVKFIPQQDTATGVGECLVFAQKGIESFFLSIPREQWKDSAFQRTALLGIGVTGHRAITTLNADFAFRSRDGWRSYRQARAEINTWSHIPLSTNIRKWDQSDTQSLLDFASAISFTQRVIGTCSPVPNNGALYHNGVVALDFDVLATFGQAVANPAWDGHWGNRELDALVGFPILQLIEGEFAGEDRAFAFIIDGDGLNALVEIQKEPIWSDTAGPITSHLITRSMDFRAQFERAEFNEKSLYGGDVWVDEVKEDTHFEINYKADQQKLFNTWDSFDRSPIQAIENGVPVTNEGYEPRHKLVKPSAETNTDTNQLRRNGYEFQVEAKWTGRAAISKLRLQAQTTVEASGPNK